jgi:hypothetical protein
MRQIRTSGSMSGVWKRKMAELVRHRQTKGSATDRLHLNHRATPRLHKSKNLLVRFARLDVAARRPTLRVLSSVRHGVSSEANLHRITLGSINSFQHDRNPIEARPTRSAATAAATFKRFYRTRARASRPSILPPQMRAPMKH